ncbi:unnamed protein product, partial [Staurois parvus]
MTLAGKGLTSRAKKGLNVCLTIFLPVSSCTLLWMAMHSTAMQSIVLTVKH